MLPPTAAAPTAPPPEHTSIEPIIEVNKIAKKEVVLYDTLYISLDLTKDQTKGWSDAGGCQGRGRQ